MVRVFIVAILLFAHAHPTLNNFDVARAWDDGSCKEQTAYYKTACMTIPSCEPKKDIPPCKL